jgi:GNAT superfamily N-acetyltransferase
MKTFVAEDDGKIVGSYMIKPNQPGLGAHVANCGYMVHPAVQGKGIGYAMGLHSLDFARKNGYRALQFNIVVSTNVVAVRLWEKLGFSIIGTVPQGFHHKELGYVDTYIMHRLV